MQYNLANPLDRERFALKCSQLREKCAVVELNEKAFRTRAQNSYLHLLIGLVAMETGNTLDYTKEQYFKRLVNKDLFVVSVKDRFAGEVFSLRSTADLTKEEMTMAIDRFKRWGFENGFYMPSPDDESLLKELQIELGRMKQFL